MSSRTTIETLAWLTEVAFERDSAHSILANLHDLSEADWMALPPGASRSIAEILEHVGWSKWMYEDYAFGTATMKGDQPPQVPAGGARARPPEELLKWLRNGQVRLLNSVRALADDSELDRERLTNWGELIPTRKIIQIMIAHDFYHAGEINHIRSLLQGTDRWPY